MGHRLSKIYTRTGDQGTTGLGDGTRVAKDCLRVEAYGTVDELNSALGMVVTESTLPKQILDILLKIQHELFDLGSELCIPNYKVINNDHIVNLENILDKLNANLPPLKEFILPGGHPAAGACHLARAICRRTERRVYSLSKHEMVNPYGLIYLNRLSDLLFVIARAINQATQHTETLWKHVRQK